MVALWRSPELEEIFGGPLDTTGLTETSLTSLISDGVRESELLDFKAKPHLGETKSADRPEHNDVRWSNQQEFAKDVCAFANHRGGLLLIGVTENDGGVAAGISPPVVSPEALERRLRLALGNHAAPAPSVAFVPILVSTVSTPADEQGGGARYCLAIIVPPSDSAPHTVTSSAGHGKHALHYPVRDGADTRWMREHEVAERYRQRNATSEDRRNLIRQTVSAGLDAIDGSLGTWLYVALIPESLRPTRLNTETIAEAKDWVRRYSFASPHPRKFDLDGRLFPAPGRVTITEWSSTYRDDDVSPTYQHCELYLDGRAFVASELEFGTSGQRDPAVIGDQTLNADVLNAVHLTTSWAVDHAGAWGTAEIIVGIASHRPEGREGLPPKLYTHEGGLLARLPGSRVPREPIRTTTATDLATCTDNQGRFAAAHHAHAALLHHFGIAEPRHLLPDGTVVATEWGRTRDTHVTAWATDQGVTVSGLRGRL